MLPSHSQDTAAVKLLVTGQESPLISFQGAMFLVNRQGKLFAEFLLFPFIIRHFSLELEDVSIKFFLDNNIF